MLKAERTEPITQIPSIPSPQVATLTGETQEFVDTALYVEEGVLYIAGTNPRLRIAYRLDVFEVALSDAKRTAAEQGR